MSKSELTNMIMIQNPETKEVLVQRRVKYWCGITFPGGHVENGESFYDSAVREVKEETNLNVTIKDVIGTYTDPNIRVAYSDGEVRQEFTIVYYGEADDYDVVLDEESSSYQWVDLERIAILPLADSQKRRIEDVIAYISYGKRNFI